MNLRSQIRQLFSMLIVTLFLAGCSTGSASTPAVPTASPNTTISADSSISTEASSPILSAEDYPPAKTVVYNSPAEAEAATGQKISAFGEAPVLAELSADGTLPPVEERLPINPVVIQPEEGIGQYGGALRKAIIGQQTYDEMGRWVTEPLLTLSPQGDVVPNLAEGWSWNDDYTVLTIYLRQGLKWSDGEPFTANDVMFWWEHVVLNQELTPSPDSLLVRNGELVEVSMPDDFTVEFAFTQPYALFTLYMASWGFNREPTKYPKHYLTQFHPEFTDMASIEALMAEGGFARWVDLFRQVSDVSNPAKPTIGAWSPVAAPPNPVEVFTRNPYYWKVDTAGNQLPYLDEVRDTRTADPEVALLSAIAGDLDFVRRLAQHNMTNLSILIDNMESGDYRFSYADWMPNSRGNIMFNFTTNDPVKHELYNNVDFRRALSLAINRDEIVLLVYGGGVYPSQVAPMRGEPFHGESELFLSWTQYDPDLANKMLDDLGLTDYSSQGFRLGPDGEELIFVISANATWPPETPELMEIVKGYWEEIGIRTTIRPEADDLWYSRHWAGEHDLSARGGHFGGGPVHPTVNPNTFGLGMWQWAYDWSLWIDSNGEQGVEPPDDFKRVRELRDEILSEPSEERRNELLQEVFQLHMDNLWSIGLVVDDPRLAQIAVVHNRLRNVVVHSISGEWDPVIPAQWFIDQ